VACASVLAIVAIGTGAQLTTHSSSLATWTLGGDFASFYDSATILSRHQGERLYDLTLQERLYREVVPGATSLRLPNPHPPFTAVMFRPLAYLPYRAALGVFLALSLLVTIGSIALLLARSEPVDTETRALAYVAGLSFFPYIGYTWLGGQI